MKENRNYDLFVRIGKNPERKFGLFPVSSIKRIENSLKKIMSIFIKREVDDRYHNYIKTIVLQSVPKVLNKEFTEHSFKGKNYTIPKNFDENLTHLYGDWKNVSNNFLT